MYQPSLLSTSRFVPLSERLWLIWIQSLGRAHPPTVYHETFLPTQLTGYPLPEIKPNKERPTSQPYLAQCIILQKRNMERAVPRFLNHTLSLIEQGRTTQLHPSLYLSILPPTLPPYQQDKNRADATHAHLPQN